MQTPYSYERTFTIVIERASVDAFGRTTFVATVDGAPLKPFTLPQNVETVGWPALKVYAEQNIRDQIADALEAVR